MGTHQRGSHYAMIKFHTLCNTLSHSSASSEQVIICALQPLILSSHTLGDVLLLTKHVSSPSHDYAALAVGEEARRDSSSTKAGKRLPIYVAAGRRHHLDRHHWSPIQTALHDPVSMMSNCLR